MDKYLGMFKKDKNYRDKWSKLFSNVHENYTVMSVEDCLRNAINIVRENTDKELEDELKEVFKVPDKEKLRRYMEGDKSEEVREYRWIEMTPGMKITEPEEWFELSENKREKYINDMHDFHIDMYRKYIDNNFKSQKGQVMGYLEVSSEVKELKGEELKEYKEDFSNELKARGKSNLISILNGLENKVTTGSLITDTIIVSIIIWTLVFYVTQPEIILLGIYGIGLYLSDMYGDIKKYKNECKSGTLNLNFNSEYNDLLYKYDINKVFSGKSSNELLSKDYQRQLDDTVNKGLETTLKKLNQPVELVNRVPLRLYELYTFEDGKLILSEDIYELEDDYKELLLTDELTEEDLMNYYEYLKTEYELEKTYKSIDDELEESRLQQQKYEKALQFSKEHQELMDENQLKGLKNSKDKWTERIEKGKQEKLKLLEENKELVKN